MLPSYKCKAIHTDVIASIAQFEWIGLQATFADVQEGMLLE